MIGLGKTDIGKVRPLNEDTLYINDRAIGCLENLYIVADGMGGHNAGEVASNESVRFFCEYIENNKSDEILDLMVSALRYANKKVYEMSLENEGYSNMGTTFVGATFKDDTGYFVHVGDSRVYIARGNKLHQITTDHTYVMEMVRAGEMTLEEAKVNPRRNIITRAIGTNEKVVVDGLVSKMMKNDIILLCSDGLTGMLSDDELNDILNEDSGINDKVGKMIEEANRNGGTDNITAIIITE